MWVCVARSQLCWHPVWGEGKVDGESPSNCLGKSRSLSPAVTFPCCLLVTPYQLPPSLSPVVSQLSLLGWVLVWGKCIGNAHHLSGLAGFPSPTCKALAELWKCPCKQPSRVDWLQSGLGKISFEIYRASLFCTKAKLLNQKINSFHFTFIIISFIFYISSILWSSLNSPC